jgi:hypothetical protein
LDAMSQTRLAVRHTGDDAPGSLQGNLRKVKALRWYS